MNALSNDKQMKENNNFRPMRRFKQQLPREACEEILHKGYRGFLSVNGEEGYPYTVPVNFLYRENHIYFHSALKGHKIDAIGHSPKACFTVIDEPVKETGDWWFHVRSVICFGQISLIGNEEERMDILRKFGEKYFPETYDIDKELQQNGPRTVVLDFSIEHMTGKQVKEN